MCMCKMAHMSVINVTPDEPAHGATGDDIRGEVFLRRDSRCANYGGQAVCGYADNFLVLVFMIEQRGNRPYLDGVTRGK